MENGLWRYHLGNLEHSWKLCTGLARARLLGMAPCHLFSQGPATSPVGSQNTRSVCDSIWIATRQCLPSALQLLLHLMLATSKVVNHFASNQSRFLTMLLEKMMGLGTIAGGLIIKFMICNHV
ncbi:hypothetical protein Peur_041426 [Populus x canadensis]